MNSENKFSIKKWRKFKIFDDFSGVKILYLVKKLAYKNDVSKVYL